MGLIAVLVIVSVVLGIALLDRSGRLVILGFSLVLILPASLWPAIASLGSDGAQKIVLVAIVAVATLKYGIQSVRGAWILIGVTIAAAGWSLIRPDALAAIGAMSILRAMLGFVFAWGVVLVKWPAHVGGMMVRTLQWLPTVSLVFGLALQFFGSSTVLRLEYTGALRLGGSLLPPHLAMLAFVAVAASIFRLSSNRQRMALTLTCWNLVVLFLTVTRGAITAVVVLVCVVIAFVLLKPGVFSGASKRKVRLLMIGTLGIASAVWPLIIQRSEGNSYEGALNTSGRDAAWEFYGGLTEGFLFQGRGLGFSNIANELYNPVGVQDAFEVPHNEYIHFSVDFGIVFGSLFFIGLLAICWRVFHRLGAAERLIFVALFIAILVYSSVDNTLSTPQFTIPLVILLSALYAENSGAKNKGRDVRNDKSFYSNAGL